MNPIGLAMTAIVGAAYLIYRYWEPIKGFFLNLWGRIKATFQGGIGSIGKAILDWSPLGLFYKAFASVASYFGVELPGSFTEFGANLIGSLVSGLTGRLAAARDTIVNFGKSIKGWFTSTLGIASPSKVFAGFGDNIAQGAAAGIGRTAPLSARASKDMAQEAAHAAVATSVAPPGAGGARPSPSGGGGSTNITFSPTINLSGGGAGIKEQVTEALKLSLHELEQMMSRVAARQTRTAY